jgi:aryl-alcohol dehydrogenase-like predicted oxidoreductase
MKKRPFGNTGEKISEVGLGCWQLGGADWGDVSDEQALAILGASLDSGVTFFDTADVYGSGRSESLIGYRSAVEPFIRGPY